VRVQLYALCQETSPKHCIWNVNLTSRCDFTNSAHPVTMTNIRHCWQHASFSVVFVLFYKIRQVQNPR